MIARFCWNCGEPWNSKDDSTEVLCPRCQYEQVKPKPEQRDLARLKEATSAKD